VTLEDDWLGVPAVRLERRASHAGSPDRYVLVKHGALRFRCEIFLTDPEAFPFEDVRVWQGLLIIGYGSTLYCVDIATRAARIYSLDDYFGSLTTGDGYCLIASATRILRIDRTGAKLWESNAIAVDGVVISNVDDAITGDGEWDPPGGWRPFALSLATGQSLDESVA
jgi:hypothetical protein